MVRRLRVMSNGKNKYTYRNEIAKDISLTDESINDYKNELFFAMLQKEYAKSDNGKDLSKSKHLLDFLEGTGFDENFEADDILDDEANTKRELYKILKKYKEADYKEKPSNNKYETVLKEILNNEEKVLIFVRRTASAFELARQYIAEFDRIAWGMIDKAFNFKTPITLPKNRDEFNLVVNKYFTNDFEEEINLIIKEFKDEYIDPDTLEFDEVTIEELKNDIRKKLRAFREFNINHWEKVFLEALEKADDCLNLIVNKSTPIN